MWGRACKHMQQVAWWGMQIESQEGLIKLPMDDLLHPGGRGTSDMSNWTQKMRDRFNEVAGKARAAGTAAYRSTVSALSADGAPMPSPASPGTTTAARSPSLAAELSTPHAPFDAYGVDGLTDTDGDDDDNDRRAAALAEVGAVKLSHLHVNDTYGLQSPGSTAGAGDSATAASGERSAAAASGFTGGNLLDVNGDGAEAAVGTGAASADGAAAESDVVEVTPGAQGEESDHDRADPDDPFSIGP